MSAPRFRIFWLVGENSGDLHASLVMRALNQGIPNLEHVGIGGSRMQAEGLKPLFPFARFNVMGFVEVLGHLGFFLRVQVRVRRLFRNDKPDLAILVDYPGLNLRVAFDADAARVPVLYFICPQFWAWKHERVYKLRDNVNHVACILPFEKELLEIHSVTASYVGHPIAEEVAFELSREEFARFYGLDPAKRWLGFLPGSRDVEVRRMLPVFLKAAALFDPNRFQVLFSKAQTVSHSRYMGLIDSAKPLKPFIIDGYRYEMMKYCVFLTSTSGTATLEAAYIGTPLAVCYKASPLSYLIGRHFVKIRRIGLPNIVLDADVLPELIQNELTPQRIECEVLAVVDDPARDRELRQQLSGLRRLLSEKTASLEMLGLVKRMLTIEE